MAPELSNREADNPQNAADPILLNENPGVDFLSPEDWLRVAEHARLTGRELVVAVLIFEGLTRYQIARRLHCAPGTIRVYIDRLFDKLNVRDRVGLVLRVMRIHLAVSAAA